jgi:23S rRNA G2445 N2-methylase RlmL
VLERFPTWRLVEDDAQFELWVHLVGRVLVLGIRLSDITMRQRAGERVYLPASLKPTVAYAMAMLSHPQASDVFLDPMCGSGTILIERAEVGRYRLLIGGDVNADAVEITRQNIGPRYKPIEIHLWDARALPLAAGSASAIVTNMPWGKQIGSADENRELYPELLREWVRVLEPAGRMVLLTSEHESLMRSIKEQPSLVLDQHIRVLVRGLPARIYVLSCVTA